MGRLLRNAERIGWIVFGLAMVLGAAFLFWLERDVAYDGDSFNWMLLSGFGGFQNLIEPYGGHLIFIPLLLFKIVLELGGDGYHTFAVPQLILIVTLAGLIYEYGRRRVGPLLALPAPILIVFLGSGWSVLLQPMIGIQFLCALVPGVAALLVLERDDRRGDVLGCVLLTVASWSFEMGLAFVAGTAVGILLRGDRWRRIWIVAVPILSYLIWKAWAQKYGGLETEPSNLLWFPAYAVDSFAVFVVSAFGLFYWTGGGQLTFLKFGYWDVSRFSEGMVFFIFEAIAAFFVVRWIRSRGPIPATFWIALTTLAVLWLEQTLALGPTRTPGEIRYVVPDAAVILLLLLECARGVRTTKASLAVAAALVVAILVGNAARFHEGRELLMSFSPNAKGAVTMLELGGENIDPAFSTATDAPGAFETGREPYFSAGGIQRISREYGRLGFTVPELEGQSEGVRGSADIVAAFAYGVHAVPPEGASEACVPQAGASETLTLPPGGAIVVAAQPAEILARRFADEFVVSVGDVGPEPKALVIPTDAAERPWVVEAAGSGGLTACPL